MRVAFLSTLLLVAFAACAAQDTVITNSTVITIPDSQSKSDAQSKGADATTPLGKSSGPGTFMLRNGEILPLQTCFTMRTYLFSPTIKGQAPKPVGYTTCTPSNALQMKQARRPRVKLLPQ